MAYIIRRPQLNALASAARERFAREMIGHVKRYFPGRCGQLGESGVRDVVAAAIEKADRLGFKKRRDVCKFINVTMAFGPEFDRKIPVFAAILRSRRSAAVKARQISEITLAVHRCVQQRQSNQPRT